MSSRLPRARRLAGEFGVIVVGVLVALLAESWWDQRARRGLDALRRRPGLSEALEARAYGIASVRDAHMSAVAWFAVLREHLDRVLDR